MTNYRGRVGRPTESGTSISGSTLPQKHQGGDVEMSAIETQAKEEEHFGNMVDLKKHRMRG